MEAPIIWEGVPQRNKNFTGRDDLLADLRHRLAGDMTILLPHALHGMGGVGKTQLAVEYTYRHMNDYQVIWWVSADLPALIRASLAALAPRLEVGDVQPGRMAIAARAVLDALRLGKPYERWLLVFDNADKPDEVLEFLPTGGPGHVIVTSRNRDWDRRSQIIEVDVFTRRESLDFLQRRGSDITEADADRLAEELGDLPLALEQAGALQAESGLSVDEYLGLLSAEATRVLEENPPADYPKPVAAAWSLSMGRLRNEMPFAWELLRRCAFFGPEPIPRDLLQNGKNVLGPPLLTGLRDPIILARATRVLNKYALARLNVNRKTLQIHRIIQRLIRDEMASEDAENVRHDVHLLLTAADPGDPDEPDNWGRYEQLLPHLDPSAAVSCQYPEVRRLVRNMVRYLFLVGDLQTGDEMAATALDTWTSQSGPDDLDVLVMAGHRADVLWTLGAYPEAYDLRRHTLDRMRDLLGKDHESTLVVTNGHGADLRARGEFAEALALDQRTLERHRSVFGDDHPQTLNAANNLAVDQGLNGDYTAAHETDEQTHEQRVDIFERHDHPSVLHSLSAMGRDLREAGRCAEGLAIEERTHAGFAALVRQRVLPSTHHLVLQQAKDLSVARRKMGRLDTALDLAEDVLEKCRTTLGEEHPDTLAAAMNLGAAQRALAMMSGDEDLMAEAARQLESALASYHEVLGPDHPYTLGCAVNLATARDLVGRSGEARQMLEQSVTRLRERLGETHHYTLIALASLATALADGGEVEQAREVGERAREAMRSTLGDNHPHTLACGANLAADLGKLGQTEAAEALLAKSLAGYERVLPADHFDVANARDGKRVAIGFEPLPL